MKFHGVAVAAWMIAASTLCACSTDETIVALTVTSSADVGEVNRLHVTLTQEGRPPFTMEFDPPSQLVDGGGEVIAPEFFERIKLPDSWRSDPARIVVDALDAQGSTFISAETTVGIRHENAVAGYVTLSRIPPAGGAGGSGGSAGASSGGTGGSSGGTTAGEAGAGQAGGSGGEDGAAGEGGGGSPTEAGSGGEAGGVSGSGGAAAG